jgi:rhamnogalacturonyl hydrolase YesR
MRRFLLFLFVILGTLLFSLQFIDSSPYEVTEDPDGIPTVDYGWLMGRYVGERRYPVTVAQRADKYYTHYMETGDPEYFKKFINNVNWLAQNRRETGDFVVFPSDFEYPFYRCQVGWVSAMTLGLALKDFIHAYDLTGDRDYLILAEKIKNSYTVEISEGGILYINPEDSGYWFAEYACETPPRVLNGFYFALDGLHHYYNATGDEEAKELFESGTAEMLRNLNDFDSGSWTLYDLEGYPSTESYHALHVEIVMDMHTLTGDKRFLQYHDKWSQYNYSSKRFYYLLGKDLVFKFT